MSKPANLPAFLLAALGASALCGCGSAQVPKHGVAGARYGATALAPSGRTARGPGAHAPRFFSASSFWNRPLAPKSALDPTSAAVVGALTNEVETEQGEHIGPWINTGEYGVSLYTVPAGQPTVRVTLDHAPDEALSSAWSAVPIPEGAQPSSGSDGYLVVWQPSSDEMWEFWRARREADGWHASWGGAIAHVSSDAGVYGSSAWPGAKPWWGATASSLPLVGGMIGLEELQSGSIEHALALAVPSVRAGVFTAPARRTDGRSSDPLALPEGARLRLDPALDLATLPLHGAVLAIAQAAQRYGIIVRDYAADVTFFAQAPTPGGDNPYTGPGGLFEGRSPSELLASFPWSHLQLVKMRLRPSP